ARLRIDPDRIGVAGFSSGAGLALWLGTRGYSAHALDTDVVATERRYPAAVITSGVCVDPAGPKEDGDFADAERFSVMSGAVGNDVMFVPVPNATHFFGFY